MTTAKEYAKAAADCDRLAKEMNPHIGDPYSVSKNQIIYHLHMVSKLARAIAEAKAKEEPEIGKGAGQ